MDAESGDDEEDRFTGLTCSLVIGGTSGSVDNMFLECFFVYIIYFSWKRDVASYFRQTFARRLRYGV